MHTVLYMYMFLHWQSDTAHIDLKSSQLSKKASKNWYEVVESSHYRCFRSVISTCTLVSYMIHVQQHVLLRMHTVSIIAGYNNFIHCCSN